MSEDEGVSLGGMWSFRESVERRGDFGREDVIGKRELRLLFDSQVPFPVSFVAVSHETDLSMGVHVIGIDLLSDHEVRSTFSLFNCR